MVVMQRRGRWLRYPSLCPPLSLSLHAGETRRPGLPFRWSDAYHARAERHRMCTMCTHERTSSEHIRFLVSARTSHPTLSLLGSVVRELCESIFVQT